MVPFRTLLGLREIRKGYIEGSNFRVLYGVNLSEAPDHVNDGVALLDVSEELVPEALASGGPLHQADHVDELETRWHDLQALVNYF